MWHSSLITTHPSLQALPGPPMLQQVTPEGNAGILSPDQEVAMPSSHQLLGHSQSHQRKR